MDEGYAWESFAESGESVSQNRGTDRESGGNSERSENRAQTGSTAAGKSTGTGSGSGSGQSNGNSGTTGNSSTGQAKARLGLVEEENPEDWFAPKANPIPEIEYDGDGAEPVIRKRRGRPPGSKNKTTTARPATNAAIKKNFMEALASVSDIVGEPFGLTPQEIEYNSRWLTNAVEAAPAKMNPVVKVVAMEGLVGVVFGAVTGIAGYFARRWDIFNGPNRNTDREISPAARPVTDRVFTSATPTADNGRNDGNDEESSESELSGQTESERFRNSLSEYFGEITAV